MAWVAREMDPVEVGAVHCTTLRNGPLRGRCYYLTALYLLFICPTCLIIALKPRSTQVLSLLALPGPRLCGLCELRYGPWGVALLLLHLLLVLTGGKENLGVCHQHKHPCCCCCCCCWCCCCLFLPPAAFAAAVVAALLPCLLGGPAALVAAPHVPTTPMFLFERNIVLRNTVVSPALFSSKRHCIENTQGLASLLCLLGA